MANDFTPENLPNGCSCSEISVTPSTWQNKKQFDPKKNWVIHYRFKDANGNNKQVQVSGMNHLKTWKERRDKTEDLVEVVEAELMGGYNPFLKATVSSEGVMEVTPKTSLIDALEYGLKVAKGRIVEKTWKDIRAVVQFIRNNVDTTEFLIGGIRRKDVVKLLKKIEDAKIKKEGSFSNNNYNHFRKYLRILFSELVQEEIIDDNPINKDLRVKDVMHEERETLTSSERERVREHLATNYPTFHRFVHVFFHSGARLTELLKVQGKDVNLEEQWFKVEVMKGKKWTREKRDIKADAFPYWQELMETCGATDYVFSADLKPGAESIDPHQITKRWRLHVKQKLRISKDLYSLKHLHSAEVTEKIAEQLAQQFNQLQAIEMAQTEVMKHNGQTTTKMLDKHYTPHIPRLKQEIKSKQLRTLQHSF